MTERRQVTAGSLDRRESPETAARDVLQEDALDRGARTESEDLAVARLDKVHPASVL